MKKRLLLFVVMALLACALFAFAVSAYEINYNETATLRDGTVLPIYDENHNSLIWFILSTETIDNGDGTTTTKNTYASVPANRNTADNATSYVTFNINSTYGTNQLHDTYIKYWDAENQKYVSYGEGTVVIYNMRSLEREYWSVGTWSDGNVLEYVYHSSTVQNCGSYRYSTAIQLVDISLSTNYTGFPEQCFRGCTNFREIRLAPGGEYALSCKNGSLFNGTALREVIIPDCVTGIDSSAFVNCSSLEKVYIGKNSRITYIESTAFANCTSLEGLYLPDGLTALSTNTGGDKGSFYNCPNLYFINDPDETTKPSVYYFPENLELGSAWNFRGCSNMNETLVLGKKITVISENTVRSGTGVKNVVCLGQITSLNRENLSNSTYPLTYWLCNENQTSLDGVTLSNSGRYSVVVCNAEGNESHIESPKARKTVEATCYSNEFLTKYCFCTYLISAEETPDSKLPHNYVDDFDCTTKNYCENYGENKCDKYLDADASSHSEKHTVIFSEGLLEAGVHNTFCENATCKVLDNEEALNPMFGTSGGYAISKAGGLAGGWTIDLRALELYNQYNEKKVTYGVVMINPKHLASEKFFNDDYTVNLAQGKTGAVITSSTDCEYSNLAFSINGFTTTELCELELVIAAYAYVDGEAVQFIQEQNTECKANTLDYEDASLYTVSYESAGGLDDVDAIEAIVPSKED